MCRVRMRKRMRVLLRLPRVYIYWSPPTAQERFYTHVEELQQTPKIMSSQTGKERPNRVKLQSSWNRLRTPPLTDAVVAIKKLNYLVIGDVSIKTTCTMRVSTVLGTGTGPNLFRRGDLRTTEVHIILGLKSIISMRTVVHST